MYHDRGDLIVVSFCTRCVPGRHCSLYALLLNKLPPKQSRLKHQFILIFCGSMCCLGRVVLAWCLSCGRQRAQLDWMPKMTHMWLALDSSGISMWLGLLRAWQMGSWRTCPKNEHSKRKEVEAAGPSEGSVQNWHSTTSALFFWSKHSYHLLRFNQVDG